LADLTGFGVSEREEGIVDLLKHKSKKDEKGRKRKVY
jgi:hypothetical protein